MTCYHCTDRYLSYCLKFIFTAVSKLIHDDDDDDDDICFFHYGPPLWSSSQNILLLTQRSRVRFPALPDFSGSGTGPTQPL
jgi:hypothetical protein